jgi:hypothetical protein
MKKNANIVDLQDERYGLFMSDNSFDLDIEYGRNFLKSDNIQYVILHKINIIETKAHSLYGQAKSIDKKFMPAVKLNIMINVEDSAQSYYAGGTGGITRDDTGKLVFGIYLKELEEKQTEIDRGDIVEYNLSGEKSRYYEVENANMVNDTTKKTIGGFKPYYKQITAVPVKTDVFNFEDGSKGF